MAPTLARTVPAFAEPRSTAARRWRLPLGLGALVVWAGWISKVDLRLLFSAQTWRSMADLLVRLFPPDLSTDFLKVAFQATLTTAATALVATALASVVALPLGVLASAGEKPAFAKALHLADATRSAAIYECNIEADKFSPITQLPNQFAVYGTCMAKHGQRFD